jgi:hypothetical protein
MTEMATQEQAFDASAFDLPIPRDRYGRKADKLVVSLGSIELDRTSEDDLNVFNALEHGNYVELRVVAFVAQASDVAKVDGEGEEETEMKRSLRVTRVELTP